MKIAIILGTRPEIIKFSSILRILQNQTNFEWFVIHTNQHYSENMDQVFFSELELLSPKYNLNIWSWNHWEMTWKMLISLEWILTEEKPDIVLVQWDTNTVLAWWIAAKKLWIKVGHVEAGLRSYDRSMPEEINRVIIDHISDYCFCPTIVQGEILVKEWIWKGNIFITWNTIVDAIFECIKIAANSKKNIIADYGVHTDGYILLTIHRPSNVDNSQSLKAILYSLNKLWTEINKKILFLMHPRTKSKISDFNILMSDYSEIICKEPCWYVETISLISNANMIATDSWWIQEEACILQKKTLILRDNTERPEVIEIWWAILIKNDFNNLKKYYTSLYNKKVVWNNPFGTWESWTNIINIIRKYESE